MPDDRTMRERIAAALDGADILVGWEYRAADTILDEMHEPTKAMVEAGNTITDGVLYSASSVWQAMLTAAKQERD